MAKNEIQLVKNESKWYDLLQIALSFILGLSGAFIVFKYLPDTGMIGIMIGCVVGWALAQIVLWLLKKVLIVWIIAAIGYAIFYYFVNQA
ncbi:MAG: hypothetical protein KAI83_18995 [Thiomargarita sp.]|nr:hypothetical protein [Thiomargarita sp.]